METLETAETDSPADSSEEPTKETLKGQRLLAFEERQAYMLASAEERKGRHQAMYISETTGASQFSVSCRSALYRAGDLSEALWEPLEKGEIKLAQARDILHRAKLENISTEQALADFKDRQRRTAEFGAQRVRVQDIAKGASPPAKPPKMYGPWQKIREAVAELVSESALDEHERDRILKEMLVEIESTFVVYRNRLRGARSRSVSWTKVREACTLLAIDVPKRGKPCNLKLARTHQRSVLRNSHPDVIGNESGVAAYQAANDSYDILVAYNESLSASQEGKK